MKLSLLLGCPVPLGSLHIAGQARLEGREAGTEEGGRVSQERRMGEGPGLEGRVRGQDGLG